jgi:hypothetical protein
MTQGEVCFYLTRYKSTAWKETPPFFFDTAKLSASALVERKQVQEIDNLTVTERVMERRHYYRHSRSPYIYYSMSLNLIQCTFVAWNKYTL